MLVIPAIDLKDGRCVRLRQGNMLDETVYSDDPASTAQQWERLGAQRLHIVDLNGAVDGAPKNLPQIQSILKAVSIPIQIGGGIRTIETIRLYLSDGAARVVLGTAAVNDSKLLDRACSEFPGRLLVGIDSRDGKVAVRGWTSVSEIRAPDLLMQLSGFPIAGVIYTDIRRDGMLEGPNVPALREMVERSSVPVIASGGISRIEDIQALRLLRPRLEGVIVGKALYDGKLDLRAASDAAA